MKTLLAAMIVALALPASAVAAPGQRGEIHKVCTSSTWIERAPADHPIAPAYKGNTFRVTRASYARARHTLWAKGILTAHDAKSGQKFTHRGWIRVAALRGC
jgi:hypothetical protein